MIIESVKKNKREISQEEKFVKSRRECIGNLGRFMKRLKQERFLTKRDARNSKFFSEDTTNTRKKSTGNE
jgi:hypothetical protein